MPAEHMGPYPKVLGHEGSGYAEAVGSDVKHVKAGDPVLLSFASCASCKDCKDGHSSFCQQFPVLNYANEQKMYSEASGQFFGQSSFASMAIVKASSVVNVKGIVSDEELKMFSPMGCGFQTGVGTIDNLAEAKAKDTVLIFGLGGVGLSGIMAAKINNCHTIIGVDRFEQRLEFAKSLGATHAINTSEKDFDLTKAVMDITDGIGADIIMDTTGNLGLIKSGLECTANRGQLIILGVPPADAILDVHLISFMSTGKRIRGSIEGDVTPSDYIPKMIQWQKQGALPIEQLIKYYKVEDFETALEDMHKGSTIKPVLLW
jgi:Zn-dependent alcohol dehydrogenase